MQTRPWTIKGIASRYHIEILVEDRWVVFTRSGSSCDQHDAPWPWLYRAEVGDKVLWFCPRHAAFV